jgi:S-adenosylmethionine:tRNA ribosyltransferase-isomerase
MKNFRDADINDYDYDLPKERIAQYPLSERDKSRLLVLSNNTISQDFFSNIHSYIPKGSLLVFNNSRVIKARLLFEKESGAMIEILCLEPLDPPGYDQSLGSSGQVIWKCLVGNLKKWKRGSINLTYNHKGDEGILSAEKLTAEGDAWRIKFSWTGEISFGQVIEAAGHVPLPPYITRGDEPADSGTYQTVYSRVNGSVAAPTAGLHFTGETFKNLKSKGIDTTEITLHVGAGTFQPVKSRNISGHEMHCEHFFITPANIKAITENAGRIIPVGTTSVRTLESLYWLGRKLLNKTSATESDLHVSQWEAYENHEFIDEITALNSILMYMKANKLVFLHASTSIIIIPGYEFRLTSGMVTNFHQPRSTLLLLISAFTGEKWKEVYNFALENSFRFLSYGDSSLLLK